MSSLDAADTVGTEGRSRIAEALSKQMRARRRSEIRFQVYGMLAIALAIAMLAILLVTIVSNGYTAFMQAYYQLDVTLDADVIDADGDGEPIINLPPYKALVVQALAEELDVNNEPIPLTTIMAIRRVSEDDLAAEIDARIEAGDIEITGIESFAEPLPLSLIADLNTMPPVEDYLSEDLRERVTLSAVIGLAGELRGVLAQRIVSFEDVVDGDFADAEILEPFADRIIPDTVTDERERTGLLRGVGRAVNDAVEEAVRRVMVQQSLTINQMQNPEFAAFVRDAVDQMLDGMVSDGVRTALRDIVTADPSALGSTVSIDFLASSDVDVMMKGQIGRDIPEDRRQINDLQLRWMDELEERGLLDTRFAWTLFTAGASDSPEEAGIGVAIVGSFIMMIVVLCLALPLGIATAIYLEEFAPKNRVTDVIEVNINNLAAVPSIVFGLLGLAVFVNFGEMGRTRPVVGGLVLTLMTLPTIIIAARAALKAVPPSIREAALGIGASKTQAIFHHVLPLAMPGILTGTIIGMAQALGETAPLLMIGMVATVVDYPSSPLGEATALPVQIFMWATLDDRGFVERTSAGIMVLLAFLVFMNAFAIWLRKKFERRW